MVDVLDDASGPEAAFVSHLLRYLVQRLDVKDKSVRLRCCQILAQCIDCIEEME